jgi:hypothetical protein
MIRIEAKAARVPAHVTSGEIIAPFDYKSLPRAQAKMAREAADFIESRHRTLSASVVLSYSVSHCSKAFRTVFCAGRGRCERGGMYRLQKAGQDPHKKTFCFTEPFCQDF